MIESYSKDMFYKTCTINDITPQEIADACGRSVQAIYSSFSRKYGSDSTRLFYSLVLDRLIDIKKSKGESVYKITPYKDGGDS